MGKGFEKQLGTNKKKGGIKDLSPTEKEMQEHLGSGVSIIDKDDANNNLEPVLENAKNLGAGAITRETAQLTEANAADSENIMKILQEAESGSTGKTSEKEIDQDDVLAILREAEGVLDKKDNSNKLSTTGASDVLAEKPGTKKIKSKNGERKKVEEDEETKKKREQFEEKYGDCFRQTIYKEVEKKTGKPKGDWMFISGYDLKTEEADCFFGMENKYHRHNNKKIKFDKLNDFLKNYPYGRKEKAAGKLPDTVSENIQEQNFEEILGEEIIVKITETGRKFMNEMTDMLDVDECWSEYDRETRNDILSVQTKKTIRELLDKVIRVRKITTEIDRKKFAEYVLEKF